MALFVRTVRVATVYIGDVRKCKGAASVAINVIRTLLYTSTSHRRMEQGRSQLVATMVYAMIFAEWTHPLLFAAIARRLT